MWDTIRLIGLPSLLPIITIIVAIIWLFFTVKTKRRFSRSSTTSLKTTAVIILLVWSLGWFFYMTALSLDCRGIGSFEKIFRSAASAIQMFAFNVDGNIFDKISGHNVIKGSISLLAIIAGICTLALIVQLIFKRFWSSIELWAATTFSFLTRSNIYLFWGWSSSSKVLADSIRVWHKNKQDEDYWIVIAEPNQLTEEQDQSDVRTGLTRLFTHKSSTLSEGELNNTLIAISSEDLGKMDLPTCDNNGERKTMDYFDTIGLKRIKKLIQGNNRRVYFFFMSDDEDYNVTVVRRLAYDSTIDKVKRGAEFFCRARRNDLYRTIEDLGAKNDMDVHVIDTSHLAIEELKRNVVFQPVVLVDVDQKNPTTVSSSLTSLIIGFDATGRDALRFLYEYGCFVDSASTCDKVFRSPFNCTIIDREIDARSVAFKIGAPAVISAKNSDGSPLVKFEKYDYNTTDFYAKVLAPIVNEVNVIFISVGNNEEGAMLAVKIFKYIRRNRLDLSRLRIFVRCYSAQKESLMQLIANHYNEGDNCDNSVIIPFGSEKETYSYEQVINCKYREEGKKFLEAYARLRGESEDWDIRREILSGNMKYKKDDNGNKVVDEHGNPILEIVEARNRKIDLNKLSTLRRKEQQDEANAIHATTKLYLLHKVLPDSVGKDFYERYFFVDENGICHARSEGFGAKRQYPLLTDRENLVIQRLAMLEHLRWNASHELLGYVCADNNIHSCDERIMQHNCLRDWQSLDSESIATTKAEGWYADYISYDFSVVDNSILMYFNSKNEV